MQGSDLLSLAAQFHHDNNLIWAPIRHHSPTCSWYLLQLIKQAKPDVILIETPHDAQSLLPYMQADECQAPVAIYLHKQARLTNETQSDPYAQRGFIPFAEMSPEWNALKVAKKKNIPCQFIDLPYGYWNESNEEEENEEGNNPLIYASSEKKHFQHRYLDALLQRSGCEHFDQWWDRHFEADVTLSPSEFFTRMHLFGLQMREGRVETDRHTQYREQYMASHIAPHIQEGKRVLVVCGAFHCMGISHYLQQGTSDFLPQIKVETSYQYLIPYPLSRLSHPQYGAHLSQSGYYAHWWKKLKSSTKKERATLATRLHTELATELMSFLQQKEHPVAMPQLVDLVVAAEHLAQLRQVPVGRSEFCEAACLILEKDPSLSDHISRFSLWLDAFFVDSQYGKVPNTLPSSPIIIDFHRQCDAFALPKTLSDLTITKELAIYRSPKHLALSQCLHRLAFLSIPYATQIAGPNFVTQTDLYRVREKWLIQYELTTETTLIELDYQGSTIVEAINYKIQQHLADEYLNSENLVALLLRSLQMGLEKWLTPILHRLSEQVDKESDLHILNQTLTLLFRSQWNSSLFVQDTKNEIERLIYRCYVRLCTRLPRAINGHSSTAEATLLSDLGKLINRMPQLCPAYFLLDAIHSLSDIAVPFEIQGVFAGLALSIAPSSNEEDEQQNVILMMRSAASQCHLTPDSLGDFCYGLGLVDTQIYQYYDAIQPALDQIISEFDEHDFLHTLPALRRAFMLMTPNQIEEFGHLCHQESDTLWLNLTIPSHDTLLQANQLQHLAEEWLSLWGISHD